MRVLVNGSTHGLPDAQAFVRRLAEDPADESSAARVFTAGRDVVVTRAPLRISLFGGLVNGTGARVLHWPLGPGIFVALQRHHERTLRVLRSSAGHDRVAASLELPLHYLETSRQVVDTAVARDYFGRYEDRRWATRPAGAVLTLMRERAVRFRDGLTLLIDASTPDDEALGAHAALYAATFRALAAAANVSLDAHDLVRFSRGIDQAIVGAAFPWTESLATSRAPAGSLLATTAASGAAPETVEWPADLALYGLRIGTPGPEPGLRRAHLQAGALMAYRIAADLAGMAVQVRGPRRVTIDDPRWRGRLASIPRGEFRDVVLPNLPESVDGHEFLSRYRGLTVGGVAIEPSTTYRVRAAAQHVVAEHDRVRQFEYLLDPAHGDVRLPDLGELLAQSHASHAAVGLADAELNRAIETLVPEFRATGGVGVTIAAGGEGRAMAALVRAGSGTAVERLGSALQRLLGAAVTVAGGTSPGADLFGSMRLRGA